MKDAGMLVAAVDVDVDCCKLQTNATRRLMHHDDNFTSR